jgi:hypothetical protein
MTTGIHKEQPEKKLIKGYNDGDGHGDHDA